MGLREDEGIGKVKKGSLTILCQQRAAIAVEAEELIKLLEEQAKEKQKEAGENFGKGQEKVPQKIAEAKETKKGNNETRTKLAKSFNTNGEYVRKAKKVKEHAPELLQDVKTGKTDLNNIEICLQF